MGGVVWLVAGLVSLNSQVDGFSRVALPAGGSVTLNSGGYVIYYEGPGAANNQIPPFNVRIVPAAPPAQTGTLKRYSGNVNYDFGSHQGRAVLSFQVAHAGRFLVIPTGAPGNSDLAFGSSIVGGIVSVALPSAALMLIGVAGAIVLLIIRIIKVRRARQARMQPPAWY